jgi:hypothetical protein
MTSPGSQANVENKPLTFFGSFGTGFPSAMALLDL